MEVELMDEELYYGDFMGYGVEEADDEDDNQK